MKKQGMEMVGKAHYGLIGLVLIMLLVGLSLFYWLENEDQVFIKENQNQNQNQKLKQVLVVPKLNISPVRERQIVLEKSDAYLQPVIHQGDEQVGGVSFVLPALAESDALYSEDLLTLSSQLQRLLFAKDQVKKTIFSINDIAQGLRPPLKRLRELSFSEPFLVAQRGGITVLSEQSYQRYNKWAEAINDIDVQAAVVLYKKYLPLFQLVFAEFSYPDHYQVLDSILAATSNIIKAPIIHKKIALVRHSVRYKFADPKLEKLSPLDKQMLRMGPRNTRMIQDKLRELIEALIASK